MRKAIDKQKKGPKYQRLDELKYGDVVKIAHATHYSYRHVQNQLSGDRTLQDCVRILADKQADENKAFLDSLLK
jgi:hypothetical protein